MAGENEAAVEDIEAGSDEGGAKQRSTIGFPYMDLDDAVEVATAIHNNVGTGECDDDQQAELAPAEMRPNSNPVQSAISPGDSGRHEGS